MSNTYLITPKFVLGSDSFYVKAASHAEAIEIAKNTIAKEDWHSPHGWDVLIEVTSFEDGGN
jgi:hypothetical protein